MNYGASLQAYALMKTISDFGVKCEIIQYHQNHLDASAINRKIQIIDTEVKDCLRSAMLRTALKRIRANLKTKNEFCKIRCSYISFNKKNYRLSKLVYNKDDINRLKYDIVLAGSDQIWNPLATKGFDDLFFGKGINAYTATYAASGYNPYFDKKQDDNFLSLVRYLDKISVREGILKEFLSENNFESTHVLDPTLIANREIFDNTATDCKISDHYILVYYLGKCEFLEKSIKKISKNLGIDLLVVNGRQSEIYFKGKTINVSSPDEFIGLVKNAEYIITNSFHGVAFSIIYRKRFISFLFNNRDRVCGLLKKLQLSSRILDDKNEALAIEIILEEIDWKAVEKILFEEREKSITFLKAVIFGLKEH